MDHAHQLSEIALVMAMAFAGGALLKGLKQPALVGYILVGLLLGPSVLGIIQDEKQISLLAEMGILLLLFVIGLELDLRNFAKVYKIALGTAVLQIAVSLGAVGALGWYLDWPLARILVLGFAVSLSSTAVAIKLLEDRDSMKTPEGQIAIGVLVAQDLAIIPMLLIIGAFEEGTFNPWGLVKIVLSLGGMGGVIYYLNKRDFKITLPEWISSAACTEGSQTIIRALAYCFCGAALSGALGLSASYGAFLAGLTIGCTQNKDKYEHNVRPIFDILMMFFFLSVGLLIDLRFVVDHIGSLLALLAFVMIMKTWVNTYVLHKLGMSWRNALIKGTILGQVGEFSFVLAAMGLAIGALQPEGYKYIVTLIAMSLITTPLWLRSVHQYLVVRKRIRARRAANAAVSAPAESEA